MNITNELTVWFLQFLFVIGLILVPIGFGFLFIPNKVFQWASSLNKWVSTDSFFQKINQPIYRERFFYRHHRLFGLTFSIIGIGCFYMLTFYLGYETVHSYVIKLADSEFEKWLFIVLYNMLIMALLIAIVISIFIFVRPSSLKNIESVANRWIDSDEPLKVLDKNQDLPDQILLGNPRVFGLIVILAAIYIIWSLIPLIK